MTVDTTMAGIFFLKSFQKNETLAPLIQNLYDITPFLFEKLADCMHVEDSSNKRVVGAVNIMIQPKKGKFKAANQSWF
jgi:hypothetical protein